MGFGSDSMRKAGRAVGSGSVEADEEIISEDGRGDLEGKVGDEDGMGWDGSVRGIG